ncbi:hypothetical protein BN1110_04030 [bacterium YEK0313]|nr:hypothetical protein BN1110_04030 [bacterium YEK0313]
MRRAALALLAVLGLAAALPGGRPAGAQHAAIALSGWERSEAATGTIHYRCTATVNCGERSTVSYRRQPDGALASLAAFRSQNEAVDRNTIEASGGQIATIDILETSEGEVAGAKVQTVIKVIDHVSGRREFMAAVRLSDGMRSYSIVSTSGQERIARANLQLFLPIVMLAGEIGGPLPRR